MRDHLDLLDEFRRRVGMRRAAAYQNTDRMEEETKEKRFSCVSFPGIKNLWSIIAMAKIILEGIVDPRILLCWFDPLWAPRKLAEIGLKLLDVIEFREEEVKYAEETYPGQVYNWIKAHPIRDEWPVAPGTYHLIVVNTLLQHLNEQNLAIFLNKLRRVARGDAKMILIFKSLPKGDLREYLDSIGQKNAVIHDVQSGDVTIFEKKLGEMKDLILHNPENVLRIAQGAGWDLVAETAEIPSKITFRSGKKLPHCVYLLKAISPVMEAN